jgi:hypothetical protein
MERRIGTYLVNHQDRFLSADAIAEALEFPRDLVLDAVWTLAKKKMLLTSIEGTERLYKLNSTHPLMKHFILDEPHPASNDPGQEDKE